MFIQYFALTLTISLFCLGLRAITDVGMLGYPIRLFFQKNAPYWGKPIVLCSTCMSSFWGTVICIDLLFLLDLGVTISAAFVNAICWEAYQSFSKA